MRETLTRRRTRLAAMVAVGALLLEGCSVDSYSNDTTDVKCDGQRTAAELNGDGRALFIVHGNTRSDTAMVVVERDGDTVSLGSDTLADKPFAFGSGDIKMGQAEQIVNGPEFALHIGNGNWIIDAQDERIVIQGSCTEN